MEFNIASVIGLFICIVSIYYINKSKDYYTILKILSLILLIYKIVEYIIMNIFSEFTFPIEISTITYFLFSVIVLTNNKNFFHIASFFGIISGIGFFAYYSTLGFISSQHFGLTRHIVAVICHGILLIGGMILYKKHNFEDSDKSDLLLVMLAILAHASIFYIDSIKGTTFVYYLVNPEFLKINSSLYLNHLSMILYYLITFQIFISIINQFFKRNKLYHSNEKLALQNKTVIF